jgi:hypothetical protein
MEESGKLLPRFCWRLHFSCPGYQLLQFSFNCGIADVFIL